MKITKVSKMTGFEHTREIDVSEAQLDRWRDGEFLHDVCPHLSADDREFLISGTTPKEWTDAFSEED